jgi:hypothetical protein
MKKPKPQIEEPQPRQVQRADLAPASGYAIIVDGHFETEFADEKAAKKSGGRAGSQVSDAEDRNLRRIIEVTHRGEIAAFRIAAAPITTFSFLIYL